MSKRFSDVWGLPKDDPFKVILHSDRLEQPIRWTKPSMIFVCSMADLFHEDVPDRFLDEVFGVILAEQVFTNCQKHTFLILTKRVERMHQYFTERTPAELLKAWAYSADWLHTDDGDVFFHELVESAPYPF
jgi:protein gp37